MHACGDQKSVPDVFLDGSPHLLRQSLLLNLELTDSSTLAMQQTPGIHSCLHLPVLGFQLTATLGTEVLEMVLSVSRLFHNPFTRCPVPRQNHILRLPDRETEACETQKHLPVIHDMMTQCYLPHKSPAASWDTDFPNHALYGTTSTTGWHRLLFFPQWSLSPFLCEMLSVYYSLFRGVHSAQYKPNGTS